MSTDAPRPTDGADLDADASSEVTTIEDIGVLDSAVPEDAEILELPAPDFRGTRFSLLRTWRLYRKRQKMAKKGYVQWFLVDGTFPKAKFVKPKLNGNGIPEVEYNGQRYLFPKAAMLPSELQGLWTVIHKQGEADPVNLRDPSDYSIPPDALQEYMDMMVTSSKPGFFDSFDMDPQTAMRWLLIGFVGLILVMGIMQNGVVPT